MRPKKRLLLLDTDADRMGWRRFLLQVARFNVQTAATPQEAALVLSEDAELDLVIAVWPLHEKGEWELVLMRQGGRPIRVPTLVLSAQQGELLLFADVVIAETTSSLVLIERVKAMTARKRGPRKGFIPKHLRKEVA